MPRINARDAIKATKTTVKSSENNERQFLANYYKFIMNKNNANIFYFLYLIIFS